MTVLLPSEPMPTALDRVNELTKKRLADLACTQTWLAGQLQDILGRPVSQQSISNWLNGVREVEPEVIFAIEKALVLAPGSLSKHLGYIPTGVSDPKSTEQAIKDDSELSAKAKRALLAAYREMKD